MLCDCLIAVNGIKRVTEPRKMPHIQILILNCVEFFILARGFVVIAIFAKPFGESIQNDGNRDTFFKKNIARNQVKARQQEYTKLNRDPLKFQHARQITQN